MKWFKITNKRRERKKKKKKDYNWDWIDILFIFGDLIIWPLRLLWFIIRMIGKALGEIFDLIGELFNGW